MKQTSGWVDQPGVYLNLLAFTVRTPTLSLRFVFQAYSKCLVQTVRDERVSCYVRGSQISATYMPTYTFKKTLFSRFPHLRRPLLHLRENQRVVDYLPNCVVIVVFLDLYKDFALFARYNHRSLLLAPSYFAHISTVPLPLLDTSRSSNHSTVVPDFQPSE